MSLELSAISTDSASERDPAPMLLGMKALEGILNRLLTAPGEAPRTALAQRSNSPIVESTVEGRPPLRPQRMGLHASAGPATVYLLLDVSQSMDEGKLRQARDGGVSFAGDAIGKGYDVGVIHFASSAWLKTNPTADLSAIRAGLEVGAQGTTNMAAAIELATKQFLQRRRGISVMVLMTDGYPDSARAALSAAKEAKRQDITIIAIGTDDADRNFLKKLATASELATTVPDKDLGATLAKAAGLLPAKTTGSR